MRISKLFVACSVTLALVLPARADEKMAPVTPTAVEKKESKMTKDRKSVV